MCAADCGCVAGDGYCEEFPFAPTCKAELGYKLAAMSNACFYIMVVSVPLVAAVMYWRRLMKRRAKQQEHSSL